MSEDGFLGRWSRRKREARVQRDAVPRESEAAEGQEPEAGGQEPEEFDVSTLPPLDALDAASDYTAFMQKGVPKALRLAALRKAWVTDPTITGYKTLADYDWDFNAPGYGKLLPTDDPKKLVDALFRHLQQRDGDEDAGEVAPIPVESERVPEPVQIAAPVLEPVPEPAESLPPEPVGVVEPDPVPVRRRHGGAVPT